VSAHCLVNGWAAPVNEGLGREQHHSESEGRGSSFVRSSDGRNVAGSPSPFQSGPLLPLVLLVKERPPFSPGVASIPAAAEALSSGRTRLLSRKR